MKLRCAECQCAKESYFQCKNCTKTDLVVVDFRLLLSLFQTEYILNTRKEQIKNGIEPNQKLIVLGSLQALDGSPI